jgi:uncharacterized membrane protein YcaP (DUF421 family)
MRIMGKRQLGELDVGEFVITILLSEIASLPITNPEKPLLDAIVPISTLALLEILSSILILKSPLLKKILSSKPSTIIARGKIDKAAMKKVRISVEDLITQVRQSGIYDLKEVDYAILEENGRMTIIPKEQYRQPSKSDLSLHCENSGIIHILISDGVINDNGIKAARKNSDWLRDLLKKENLSPKDIFCMTYNDAGHLYIIYNDGTARSIKE